MLYITVERSILAGFVDKASFCLLAWKANANSIFTIFALEIRMILSIIKTKGCSA